ncbi:MAG TPA: hypothetical protein VGF21_14750 [Thermoleophilaceae bacterium]|jgi:hypothetical protein
MPSAWVRAAVLACLAALLASGIALAQPYGRVKRNPADRLASLPIDDYHYDYAKRCRKHPAPGTVAMEKWLTGHSRGVFWGDMRCEKLGRHNYSLHADGRAIDWHLDVHKAADRRAARKLILTLLATDKAGNAHALARRMGVQEIIWDCRSWWAGADRMGKYSYCYTKRGKRKKHLDETQAHRNHVHIGLNWAGARKRTSFWKHYR